MREFSIIRHGQANYVADNEQDYDRLSPFGEKQADQLGHWMTNVTRYDAVVSGTLNRQRETARRVNSRGLSSFEDARLNELDYFGLSASLCKRRGMSLPQSAEAFYDFMVVVLEDWENGEMCAGLESFEHFQNRIQDAVFEALSRHERPLLVSSGGVIGTLMHLSVGGPTQNLCRFMSEVAHTSLHHFKMDMDTRRLRFRTFAATPHFDHDPENWVTYA